MNKLVPVSTYLSKEDVELLRNMTEHAAKYLRKILAKYDGFDELQIRVKTNGTIGADLTDLRDGWKMVNETKYADSGWCEFASGEVDDDNSGSN